MMSFEPGQRDDETREEFLFRLKENLNTKEYLDHAIDELAVHLTKGLEKGLSLSDGNTETEKKKK